MEQSPSVRSHQSFRRSLITFAAVSDELARSNDFLLGIAPIFSPIADIRAGGLFRDDEFVSDVRELFGLSVPKELPDVLVHRLAKAGLVERQSAGDRSAYFWKATENGASQAPGLASQIDEVVRLFLEFAKDFNGIFGFSYDRDDIEAILFEFLVSHDRDLTAAQAALSEGNTGRSNRFNGEGEYLCARFLERLSGERSDLFTLIGQIANAAILSEVVIDLSLGQGARAKSKPETRSDVRCYLDAPFVLDALGLSGTESKAFAQSIIDGLRRLGANLAVFDHSVDEMRDILKAVVSSQGGRRGQTAAAIRQGAVDKTYVAHVLHNVERVLEEAGFSILEKPNTSLTAQQRDYLSQSDVQRIYQLLQPEYQNSKALDRDVASLEQVIRRRQGAASTDLLRCKHLLITRNEFIRVKSRVFLEENKGISKHKVPPAETISRVAASLWLELGSSEQLSISRAQLVAACSKVAQARPELIASLQETLRRVVPEKVEQFEAMMAEPRMMRLATDLMLGDEKRITEASALRAFEQLKESIEKDARKDAAKKQAAMRAEHKKALSKETARAEALESEIVSMREARRRTVREVASPIIERAHFLALLTTPIAVLAALGAALAPSLVNLPPMAKTLATIVTAGVALLSVFGATTGSIRKWAEGKLAARVRQKLVRLGYEEELQGATLNLRQKRVEWAEESFRLTPPLAAPGTRIDASPDRPPAR
ncbi:MAG: hypothetical protein IT535_04370 [Bauldia sp.]|nr:hypothetical protein [Bauldia sp.]